MSHGLRKIPVRLVEYTYLLFGTDVYRLLEAPGTDASDDIPGDCGIDAGAGLGVWGCKEPGNLPEALSAYPHFHDEVGVLVGDDPTQGSPAFDPPRLDADLDVPGNP